MRFLQDGAQDFRVSALCSLREAEESTKSALHWLPEEGPSLYRLSQKLYTLHELQEKGALCSSLRVLAPGERGRWAKQKKWEPATGTFLRTICWFGLTPVRAILDTASKYSSVIKKD